MLGDANASLIIRWSREKGGIQSARAALVSAPLRLAALAEAEPRPTRHPLALFARPPTTPQKLLPMSMHKVLRMSLHPAHPGPLPLGGGEGEPPAAPTTGDESPFRPPRV